MQYQMMLSFLQKLGVPGYLLIPSQKKLTDSKWDVSPEGWLGDLWRMQNAAVTSSVRQDDPLKGQVHGHSVSLRNRELGEANRGTAGYFSPGGLPLMNSMFS